MFTARTSFASVTTRSRTRRHVLPLALNREQSTDRSNANSVFQNVSLFSDTCGIKRSPREPVVSPSTSSTQDVSYTKKHNPHDHSSAEDDNGSSHETTPSSQTPSTAPINTQLDLRSPVDSLRYAFLGPYSKIRSQNISRQLFKNLNVTPLGVSSTPKQQAQSQPREQHRNQQPRNEYLRKRPTQFLQEGGFEPVKVSESSNDTARNINDATLSASSTAAAKSPDQQELRSRLQSVRFQEISVDLIRAQIRACREPEDIMRVMDVALRRMPNPQHSKNRPFSWSEELAPENDHNVPQYLTNPAAAYFATSSVQYSIAKRLAHQGFERAERFAASEYKPINNIKTRVLACANTLLHRFRSHDPLLVLDLPIIRTALLTAVSCKNWSALQTWLCEWRAWTNAYSHGAMATKNVSILFIELCSSIISSNQESPLDSHNKRALHLILNPMFDHKSTSPTDQHIRSFLQKFHRPSANVWQCNYAELLSYINALALCSDPKAILAEYISFKTYSHLHMSMHDDFNTLSDSQATSLAKLPAVFADILFKQGANKEAWQIWQDSTFDYVRGSDKPKVKRLRLQGHGTSRLNALNTADFRKLDATVKRELIFNTAEDLLFDLAFRRTQVGDQIPQMDEWKMGLVDEALATRLEPELLDLERKLRITWNHETEVHKVGQDSWFFGGAEDEESDTNDKGEVAGKRAVDSGWHEENLGSRSDYAGKIGDGKLKRGQVVMDAVG